MTKTILSIEGMQCGMCEAHVNDAIRNNFAVKKVTSAAAPFIKKDATTEMIFSFSTASLRLAHYSFQLRLKVL